MKRILLVVAVLALAGGIASADHRHRGYWHQGGHAGHSGFSGGVYVSAPRVVVQPRYVAPRVYTEGWVRPVVRRPIFMPRPVVRVRYYNYYQRPTLVAENYPPMTGYYWVAGRWDWNGYEWIWAPGHYEPDPRYQDTTYYPQQDGYSQDGYPDDGCDHNQY